jgi:PAS domain S-box-containing protein
MIKDRKSAITLPEGTPKNLKPLSSFILGLVITLAIIVMSFGGYALFYSQEQRTLQIVERELESSGLTKANQISLWSAERMRDAQGLMNDPSLIAAASQFIMSPDNSGQEDVILSAFAAKQNNLRYQDILLVSSDFKISASLNKTISLIPDTLIAQIYASSSQREAVWIDFYLASTGGTPQLGIIAPLFIDQFKPAVGVVLLSIDPSQILYPLMQAWPSAGSTGEILLLERNSDQVLFLNGSRFQKDTALNKRIELSQKDSLFVMAVQGAEGVFSGQDYRGVEVLASLNHVPDSPWYLVTKMDYSEIFARWSLHGALLIALVVGMMSILLIAIGFFWHRSQKLAYSTLLRAEIDRKALVSHFDYLVKYANDSILLFDEQNRLVQINDRALEYYGYKREEILGSYLDYLIAPDSLAPFKDNLNKILEKGSITIESVHKRKDRTEFPVETCARILKIDDKTYLQMVSRDLTERKTKEEEIRKLSASIDERVAERTTQLENANKELEYFAYSVSHDLRAPLRGIDGWSQALVEDYKDKIDDKGFQIINRIRSETQRMGQMIEDLLKFSRETRSELIVQDLDMTSMVQTTASRLQQSNPSRQVQFVIQPGMKAKGDFHLLEIAFMNLLDNAIKFTSKCPQPLILVGEIHKNDKRAFFVRDNGAGFDMAYNKKLFKVFQRLHKASDYPGTGVGLATVQRIITRHGGQIWAEAQVNEGATFYFTLKEDGDSPPLK